jgi:hypothetical protein
MEVQRGQRVRSNTGFSSGRAARCDEGAPRLTFTTSAAATHLGAAGAYPMVPPTCRSPNAPRCGGRADGLPRDVDAVDAGRIARDELTLGDIRRGRLVLDVGRLGSSRGTGDHQADPASASFSCRPPTHPSSRR